jgi:hypothetical protein
MTFLSAQPYLNMSMCNQPLLADQPMMVDSTWLTELIDGFWVVINERVLYFHEKDAKLYGAVPYYLSILTSSMPLNLSVQIGFLVVCITKSKRAVES